MAWHLLICVFCAGTAAAALLGFLRKRFGRGRRPDHPPRSPHPASGHASPAVTRSTAVPTSPCPSARALPTRLPVSGAALPPELRFPVCPVLGCRNTAQNRRVIRRAGGGEYFCTRCQYRFHPHVKIH